MKPLPQEAELRDSFLKARLQAMQKEGTTSSPTHYVFDINELATLITEHSRKEREAGFKTAENIYLKEIKYARAFQEAVVRREANKVEPINCAACSAALSTPSEQPNPNES